MELAITEHIIRTFIVNPQGRLDAFRAPAARQQLDQLIDGGATNFIVDLSETLFLDSAGMAVLVSLLKRARQAGGTVKLVWPKQEAVQRTLSLTRFDRVFEMVDSVEKALKSF